MLLCSFGGYSSGTVFEPYCFFATWASTAVKCLPAQPKLAWFCTAFYNAVRALLSVLCSILCFCRQVGFGKGIHNCVGLFKKCTSVIYIAFERCFYRRCV